MSVTTSTSIRGRITAGFDMQGALAASRNLGILADRLPLFQKRALGTLRRRLLVEARRDIQAEYNIGAARIRKDLSARETPDGIKLTGFWRGIGLRNFGARTTRKGVTSSIYAGGRRSLREDAFMARLQSGNLQVVKREGEKRVMTAGRYKGKRRQPLAVQYGPTAAQMLGKGRRPNRLADFAVGLVGAEITRQIDGYTKGRPIPGADN